MTAVTHKLLRSRGVYGTFLTSVAKYSAILTVCANAPATIVSLAIVCQCIEDRERFY